tara:strand:- start:461 stop:745 length:285 start_codon:yes stop_codon:yes gene_type:complete
MTSSFRAKASALNKYDDTVEAAAKKYKDRGSHGMKAFGKKSDAALKKFGEDHRNAELYGKDAMKGKGFATTGRPKSINAGASRPATQSGTPKGK